MVVHKRFDSDGEDGEHGTDIPTTNLSNASATKVISKPKPRHLRKGRQQKSVRGQIRSIERLLKNRGSLLAPAARTAKEKELAELTRLREEHDRRERERTIAKEYRMLKFVEKRKLQRVLDRIIEKGDKPEEAEKKKQVLRDLRYVNEYPKDKKYVALFPTGGHTPKSRAKMEAVRAEIEGSTDVNNLGDTAHGEGEGSDASGGQDVAQSENQDDFFLEAE